MTARGIGLIAICGLTLAACSPSDADESGIPLDQVHPPRIKAGLWEVAFTGGVAVPTRQLCDGGRSIITARSPGCAGWQAKLIGRGTIVLTDSCDGHGETTRLRRTVTGDLNSSFVVDDRVETDRGLLPPLTEHRVSTYRYLGSACPVGTTVRRGTY
jgi:hypothetical protein